MMLTLRELLTRRGDPLQLESLTGELGLDRPLPDEEISSPGLALAGYTARFTAGRLHVFGETEITYLGTLTPEARLAALGAFFSFDLPCVFVTKGQAVPAEMLALATERSVPVLRSRLRTAEFYRRIKPILEEAFAPSTTLHGSLADVYGVGLLFIGRSGIGKSECVLDLVERGHRLVADDVVQVTRRGDSVLIGRGHELAGHHMEIRGIGLIDIPALFGVRAVRQQKRIEVVVQLEDWETARDQDRTGLAQQKMDILDVEIPRVVVALNPGKNITVIAEVVAMMHLLRYSGVDVAASFNERLIRRMKEQRGLREYLQHDYE
ncbi:MAG TPA: HPr(Ser) kinase/phosphatase [Gemmatimonadales bacterium]|nr:HPr(Ser) kinase/phosphatase [Gemmatimonadales bacterium]